MGAKGNHDCRFQTFKLRCSFVRNLRLNQVSCFKTPQPVHPHCLTVRLGTSPPGVLAPWGCPRGPVHSRLLSPASVRGQQLGALAQGASPRAKLITRNDAPSLALEPVCRVPHRPPRVLCLRPAAALVPLCVSDRSAPAKVVSAALLRPRLCAALSRLTHWLTAALASICVASIVHLSFPTQSDVHLRPATATLGQHCTLAPI